MNVRYIVGPDQSRPQSLVGRREHHFVVVTTVTALEGGLHLALLLIPSLVRENHGDVVGVNYEESVRTRVLTHGKSVL